MPRKLAAMSQRIVHLDMGPVYDQVRTFVKKAFAPDKVTAVKADKYAGADVLVCGDWRVVKGSARSQPGGDVLASVLDRGKAPKTLIYALLGSSELKRAMRARSQGVAAIEGWRRIVGAGGRVIVLQVDRWNGRKPFTLADAKAALPTIAAGSVALWHDPIKTIRV